MGKGLGHFLKDDRGMVSTHKKWILHCVMTVGSMEVKMLTTVTYNIPTGMSKIKMSDNAKYWQR